MNNNSALDAAKDSMKWWNRYYHGLLFIHFSLGVLGVLVGALIAADFDTNWAILNTQFLGVVSTIIVGIVSFVQPGRMATVFYDAYWRMRVAILRHVEGHTDSATLVDAIAVGFTSVAEIQPEPPGHDPDADNSANEDAELTDEQKAKMAEFRAALLSEAKTNSDPADETPSQP